MSGGTGDFGILRIYRVEGEDLSALTYAGSKLISMPAAAAAEGFTKPGVPRQSGIPVSLFLYGTDNVYIPVIGMGVPGVRLSDALNRADVLPGKFVTDSPVTSVIAGGVLLTGGMRRLKILSPDMGTEHKELNIPARSLAPMDGFPAGFGKDGKVIRKNLAAAGDMDGTVTVLSMENPREPLTLFTVQTGGRSIQSLAADAEKRLIYAASSRGVHVIDARNPEDGDYTDRVLGTVEGLDGANDIDIGSNGIGYVSDPANGKVHVFERFPMIRISPVLCEEEDGNRERSALRRDFFPSGSGCRQNAEYVSEGKVYSYKFNISGIPADSVVDSMTLRVTAQTGEAGFSGPEGDFVTDLTLDAGITVKDLLTADYCRFRGIKSGTVEITGHLNITSGGDGIRECPLEPKTVTVVKTELVPDYNHDRKIDDTDRALAADRTPFRFWLNNDDDDGDISRYDVPEITDEIHKEDYKHAGIDGIRDLVDFFPVFIDVKEALNVFDPDRFRFVLASSPSESFNMISMTDIDPGRSGEYLTNLSKARQTAGTPLKGIGNDGVEITKNFLNAIKDHGKGVVLLEAKRGDTVNQELQLKIFDSNNT